MCIIVATKHDAETLNYIVCKCSEAAARAVSIREGLLNCNYFWMCERACVHILSPHLAESRKVSIFCQPVCDGMAPPFSGLMSIGNGHVQVFHAYLQSWSWVADTFTKILLTPSVRCGRTKTRASSLPPGAMHISSMTRRCIFQFGI